MHAEKPAVINVALEKAKPEDLPIAIRIFKHYGGYYEDVNCGNTFVARSESLGVVGAVKVKDTPSKGVVFLATMGVEPHLQKRGIGNQLLEQVIEELRKEGIHKAIVNFRASDAENLGKFFEKRGFVYFYQANKERCGMKRDL